MLRSQWKNSKCQFHSPWFDPTVTGTHESTTLDANDYTTDAV